MALNSVIEHIKNSNLTLELIERCDRKDRLVINGGGLFARSLIASAIAQKNKRPLLIIVPTLEEAARWSSLVQFIGLKKTYLYPTSENSPYEILDTTSEILWGQMQVISELMFKSKNEQIVVIASERSLQPHLPPKEILSNYCISLERGLEKDIENLSISLSKLGYNKVSTTEQEGNWSRRGDIVDIYPVNNELPIRLEFFGDEITKIKEYDPISQRSLEEISKVQIMPTNFNSIIIDNLIKKKPKGIEKILGIQEIKELEHDNNIEGIRRLMPIAWDNTSSLLDYIDPKSFVILDNRSSSVLHAKNWLNHVKDSHTELLISINLKEEELLGLKTGGLHKEFEICLKELSEFKGLDMNEINTNKDNPKNTFELSCKPIQSFPNQFGKISEQIKLFRQNKTAVWIISAQPSRCVALLDDHECISKFVSNPIDNVSIKKLQQDKVAVALKVNSVSEVEGLFLPKWNLSIFTDREFFGQYNLNNIGYIRKRARSASKTIDPNKIQEGDYVVHRNHGIGRFRKIEKIVISGEARDYLLVQYLDGTLRVAADQLGTLGRYRNSSKEQPKINKLGGSTWIKAKAKAKRSIKKIAFDLVQLYAERNNIKSASFGPDGPWQKELEESFPYEPTADQLKAVNEVKKDMERDIPMDRLICGDVGFGKTEIAIRAIFKAITSGKQVALLAPTTILTQQHWRTLSDRFAPYPIKVGLLNRFKTLSERNDIINGLSNGKIDAVVGTHQLLGKRIDFKKLGLLVIDEEQRFGVTQKEKIKALKKNIDVLTLSATPIPRTLHMSLSGVREMSLITTPPPSRQAIKTHLTEKDEEIVRSAISQELDRGGQIFYVVPKVAGIEEVAEKLKNMIPKLKLIIAHGQMPEGQLEMAMVDFNNGEGDLMLCTTIIESGLDIPRVNTIIIEDAHLFGLSQLYQLRGRVGRSGVQAHAWLFYTNQESLNESARKRLRAVQEFSQLGSGYQLAIRDMEIRGVGNLLGMQQSGQMESIGFDTYMEILQECLAEIKGQDIPKVEETQIDLPVTAFIPADWITDSEEKIAAYKVATSCTCEEELIEIASSWTDRYGLIPPPVSSLIQVIRLKLLAQGCGISRIKRDNSNVIMETEMEESAFRKLRKGLASHLHGRFIYSKSSGGMSKILVRGLGSLNIDSQISQLSDWMKDMLKLNLDEVSK